MSDFVSVEYRCDACGDVEWLESPLTPLRRFLAHFCSELGSYTVMRGFVAENSPECFGENICE